MGIDDAERITEGSLLRALVALALPLFLQNLIQVAQLLIDLFWLGRYSEPAVAALGLIYPLTGLLFALIISVPFIGTQVLVSQRFGGDDDAGAKRATATGILLGVVLSLVTALVAWVGAEPFVDLITMSQPGAVAENVSGLAATYFTVLALGGVFASTGDVMEASFVARGDSRTALYMSVVTIGVNAVLDPILIFGVGPLPSLGMAGAAFATVAGYVASLGLAVAFNAVGRAGGVVSTVSFGYHREELREIIDIGYPKAAQSFARRTARLFVVSLVFAVGGSVGLAAYIIGSRVSSVASIPATGLQSAVQSVVGQNLGSDQPDRANRATWLGVGLAGVLLGGVAAVQWTIPGVLVDVLAPTAEGELYALAVEFLRILALGYPALGVVYLFQGGFNGARHTRVSFVSSLLQYWAVQVPIAVAVALWLDAGVTAIFWGMTASNVVAAVGLGVYYVLVSNRGLHADAVNVEATAGD